MTRMGSSTAAASTQTQDTARAEVSNVAVGPASAAARLTESGNRQASPPGVVVNVSVRNGVGVAALADQGRETATKAGWNNLPQLIVMSRTTTCPFTDVRIDEDTSPRMR